jgi:DNA repair protein RecN (Recombination protein N)
LLAELKVKSFGIIDELNWSPAGGFNVVTGETGAGKSLVIDAIEALLDGRLDEESIRFGADSARIEAVFFIAKNPLWPRLRELLEEKGVAVEEDDLVMSCEFRRQGRAIIRINGSAVTRSLLREIGGLLVDVHGQSEHLSLFDKKHHLDYLDAYAHCNDARTQFGENTSRLYTLEEELEKLKRAAVESAHRQEILRYQNDEIKRAKLKDGEEEELEQKRRVMSSCEKLKALAYEAYQALNGDDGVGPVALSRLNEAIRSMQSLVSLDPSLKAQSDTLEGALASLEETARDIRSYEEGLEYDPRQLEEIESRLELIHGLKKKYGSSVTQIMEQHVKIEAELAQLESVVADETRLKNDVTELKIELGGQARLLSETRRKAATRFEKAVEAELAELNMSQVQFEVSIKQTLDDNEIPFSEGLRTGFNKDGADDVEFMVSTNPGEPLKPLADIASTGEVSRFTLALKVALAEADSTPVLIFDEIDIGVGGRSGDVIGKKLWSLARHHQIICVTHLPQIAVFGDAHFSVNKEATGARITSSIAVLEGDERTQELAVMLGGASYSETSVKNARELAQKAETWKNSEV